MTRAGFYCLIRICRYLAGRVQGRAQKRKQAFADTRLSLVSEAVTGIRALKLGAWEEAFEGACLLSGRPACMLCVHERLCACLPVHMLPRYQRCG